MNRLAKRRSKSDRIVAPELARALSEISAEIQRQVGVLLDRQGHVRFVVVGNHRSLFLPDLAAYRRGRNRLCGLRLVHTHLQGEPLTDDDLTDLALLRLDLVAAIAVSETGLPGKAYCAHLVAGNDRGDIWQFLPPVTVHELPEDFPHMIAALEDEISRARKPRSAGDNRERAIIVNVSRKSRRAAEESLAELRELSRSAGIDVVGQVYQRRPVDPRYVMGKGRLNKTIIKAMQSGAEALVLDLNLSPAQVKAMADYTDLKILDRTQIILDIFAQHAQTREGKIQVELAQLRYMLPRLSGKHTAMSRLTGGIGGRGPGETKLEVDRRHVQDRIARLSREVAKLGERRKLRRSVRVDKRVPVVSIVGYTNAGKSSLLNTLTKSGVNAEDAPFATLNPVSRRLRFPREREVIITDTVGFIRNLPDDLMAAFRTTFEELHDSDLLLHVVDASTADVEERVRTVNDLLAELNLNDKPCLAVLNKIDRCEPSVVYGLTRHYNCVPVCAVDEDTLGPLLDTIDNILWPTEEPGLEYATEEFAKQ